MHNSSARQQLRHSMAGRGPFGNLPRKKHKTMIRDGVGPGACQALYIMIQLVKGMPTGVHTIWLRKRVSTLKCVMLLFNLEK